MYERIQHDANLPAEISDEQYSRLSQLNKLKYRKKTWDRSGPKAFDTQRTGSVDISETNNLAIDTEPPAHFDFKGGSGGGSGATGHYDTPQQEPSPSHGHDSQNHNDSDTSSGDSGGGDSGGDSGGGDGGGGGD